MSISVRDKYKRGDITALDNPIESLEKQRIQGRYQEVIYNEVVMKGKQSEDYSCHRKGY